MKRSGSLLASQTRVALKPKKYFCLFFFISAPETFSADCCHTKSFAVVRSCNEKTLLESQLLNMIWPQNVNQKNNLKKLIDQIIGLSHDFGKFDRLKFLKTFI